MTLENFIKENKTLIDEVIKDVCKSHDVYIDDEERELWVLNDEGLYNFAIDCGVEEI